MQKTISNAVEAQAETGIGDLLTFGFGIGILSIGLAYMLQVQADVKSDMTTNSAEYNATGEGIAATAKIPAKLGTIVTVYLAGIIIFFLMRYLYHRVVD